MAPFEIADEDRAAYHAAASVASNFLVTLEAFAERLAAPPARTATSLVPLVRATVENWAARGAERALTGPIARGDEATVARQRAAVAGAHARAPGALRRARRRHPRPRGASRREGRPDRPGAARGAASRARRARGRHRPRAHDGRAARGPPVPDPRARARSATRSSSRCSSTPRQFDDAARPRRLSARRAGATPSWRRRRAPTCSSPPPPPRSTRPASPPRCSSTGR